MSANLKLVAPAHADTWNDDEIKKLADENRRLAMEMVVQKYRDRLFYHAVYIVKDWEEAYDAVQELSLIHI